MTWPYKIKTILNLPSHPLFVKLKKLSMHSLQVIPVTPILHGHCPVCVSQNVLVEPLILHPQGGQFNVTFP